MFFIRLSYYNMNIIYGFWCITDGTEVPEIIFNVIILYILL